jgi:hypothetical protein
MFGKAQVKPASLMFGKAQVKTASLMNELDRRLREAGQVPVPPPDPAFATMLEDRLRVGALAPEPALRPAPRPTGRWFPVAAVAAALGLVLGSVAVLRGGDDREVRVASATDTVVVLPDGTVGPATPGLVIPDGSRLQTGSEGHVVAGETELGPKQEAKINKGNVKQSPTTVPPTAQSDPSSIPSTVPTATTFPPVGAVTPPSTSPATAPTPTTRPPVVVSPSTKPTTRPTDTKATTSTSGPTNMVAALEIDARYKGETVKLQWSAYTGQDFAAYLVLRADGPAEPRYPVDEATTVVARITDPYATTFMETTGDPAGRVYRVVAVDTERRLIATTPAAKPQPLA